MTQGRSFALNISKWVEAAKGDLDLVVQKISLDLFSRVILRSPVDTGRFRANWQIGIGNIPDGVLELDDKTGQATISTGAARVAGIKAGDVVYLVNSLPYSLRLEFGFTGTDSLGRTYNQPPKFIVGLTVEEYISVVNKAASEVKRG
jgi:hypothetical protein